MSNFVEKEYAESLKGKTIYDLQGVQINTGGHYIARCRLYTNNNGEDTWGEMDDTQARVLNDVRSVQDKRAKVLFYARRK